MAHTAAGGGRGRGADLWSGRREVSSPLRRVSDDALPVGYSPALDAQMLVANMEW